VLCVAFICAAFTLDIFCLVFVPLHWLFFVASTYVLFNYIWHTAERGLCVSSLWLWVLLLYTEASLRLRDLKSSHANLSHLFAAHCIGYPVVYLGFDATCYFSSAFKLRVQRTVQSDPNLHLTLTSGLQLCPKGPPDASSKWKGKPDCGQYQCPTGLVVSSDQAHVVDCLQIRSEERTERPLQEAVKTDSTRRVSSSSISSCLPKSSEALHRPTENCPESLPQEEQGGKGHKASKNTSPKARRSSHHTPSPPGGRVDKKQRAKTISPNRNTAVAHSLHADQMNKLEQDVRRLKAELQSSRQTEQELKSHLCNLSNSERSLRPELDLLREANMLLHTKLLCLGKTKQRDKQTSALLEKKTRAETEARLSVERQLNELHVQMQEEAAARSLSSTRQEHPDIHMLRRRVSELEVQYQQLQREGHLTDTHLSELHRDLESLGQCGAVEQGTELLLSSLSALQDKAHQLELSLSAETRIKLDLFSALGDARRQLQIAH
ncbi:hypothetical protein NL108_008836, partial [Boleophthalmus pectinirostris]